MASGSSSPTPAAMRRKPLHIAALSLLVVFSFVSSAWLAPRRKSDYNQELDASSPTLAKHPSLTLMQNNSTSSRRILKGWYRPLRMSQFVMHSGSFPESHPSRPYFVIIDESGAYVQTVEDGGEDHPLSRLADLREPRDVENEAVFFFVVPKSSGGKMNAIMTNCYELRRAQKREDPESLRFDKKGVLNVDTQTLKGLQNARSNNLIDKGLVDVFTTSYFLEGSLLFKPNMKGRAFTIVEHPVIRAEKLYQSRDPGIEWMKFPIYIESVEYIDNWMVRSLTNDKTGELTEDHLLIAKGILARKFFVGVAEYMEETIKRIELYYGWKPHKEQCVRSYLEKQRIIEEDMPRYTIERGGAEWEFVAENDKFDMMLYYYALELFAKQGSTMFKRPYVDRTGEPIDFTKLKKKEDEKKLLWELLGGG